MIVFWIVLFKCKSLNKDEIKLQEDPIAPIALMERLADLTFTVRERGVVNERAI